MKNTGSASSGTTDAEKEEYHGNYCTVFCCQLYLCNCSAFSGAESLGLQFAVWQGHNWEQNWSRWVLRFYQLEPYWFSDYCGDRCFANACDAWDVTSRWKDGLALFVHLVLPCSSINRFSLSYSSCSLTLSLELSVCLKGEDCWLKWNSQDYILFHSLGRSVCPLNHPWFILQRILIYS